MTPLYNSNDYYKKMLDLQERLRKSEEERIRLEERFSLLEHESRSRHETCINRLRMRYIDFLEEQQARDERNHQLLGALDRVDTSLALMTAKTDRLGALRKQYEASILARHENRRPNGSVTGDSGVASQHDEGHRRCLELYNRGNGNVGLPPSRSKPFIDAGKSRLSSSSTSQARPGASYGGNWSGIRCETCPTNQASFAYSRRSPGVAGNALTRDNGLSAAYTSPEPPTRFLGAKTSSEPRESIFQSQRYVNDNSAELSRWDLRRNDPAANYQKSLYSSHQRAEEPSQSLKYGRSVARNLAASGAYDSVDYRFSNSAPGAYAESYERGSIEKNSPRSNLVDVLHRNSHSTDSNRVSNLEERKTLSSSTRSPKLSDILRQELGDDEQHIGHLVENQLERYISKIRSLHRVAEPQSLEEMDHEQNTSGDLLNASLSDDGLDLQLVEDKPRERLLPQDLGNVLALASDLANQTATNAISVANNMYENASAGGCKVEKNDAEVNNAAAVNRERNNKSDEQMVVPEAGEHQLASINRSLDQPESHENENISSNEKRHESLAKNGISREVAKAPTELAPRPRRNIREIAKLIRSSEDTDQGASRRIGANPVNENHSKSFDIVCQTREHKRDNFSRRSSSLALKQSQYKNGEQRENDENLDDVVEDLEPWNLSALERRVQEIILNDEAQDDFVSRGLARKIDATPTLSKEEHEDLAIEEIVEPEATERPEFIMKNEETEQPSDSCKNNDETEGSKLPELAQSSSGQAAEPNAELPEETITQLREEESPEAINYSTNDVADPNVDYQPNENPAAEYAYNADAQYAVPEEEYSQYNPNDGLQYDEAPDQQYEYSNQQYLQDPNQQNYVQDPTQETYAPNTDKQIYQQDVNQQNYMQDPNQQVYAENFAEGNYSQDVPQENYAQDPNQQEWHQDPNQQYDVDVDQQFVQDQQYDINQEYSGVPEEQYAANPDDQYLGDEQYSAQPNDAYSTDYVQHVSEDYPTPDAENPHPEAADDLGAQEDPADAYESSEKLPEANTTTRKTKDVIKSILDSDTDTTIEKNVSNTDSDFDFN